MTYLLRVLVLRRDVNVFRRQKKCCREKTKAILFNLRSFATIVQVGRDIGRQLLMTSVGSSCARNAAASPIQLYWRLAFRNLFVEFTTREKALIEKLKLACFWLGGALKFAS